MHTKTTRSRRRNSAVSADGPKLPAVLHVEDNAQTRALVKHLLSHKYEITAVCGFAEALRAIGSGRPFDLFLFDVNLGSGPNGTDLLREMRAQEDAEKVPAIALTTYAAPGDRRALLNDGFDEYVAKPFTREELTEAIENAL